MGASESTTAKTNGTGNSEEKRQQESGGSSIGERSVWSPPPTGRFKINTDGGCHSIHGRPYEYPQDLPDDRVERRPSGYGGILRDHRGNFVRGFRGFIGVTDCFTAELHGIHKGLELLDKLRYHGAILESDCQPVVEWINGKDHNNTSKSKIIRDSWNIIVECRRLAHKNNTAINHVKGDDANLCAHKLADLAIDKEDIHVEIEDVSQLPGDIKRLVDKDANTGSSIGKAVAIAAAGVATAGFAAWGISKMLSENNDRQQKEGHHGMESLLINCRQILEGAGCKRSVWCPPPTGRFKINTDGGCHSIHGRPYESPQDLPPHDRIERRPSGYGGILRDHRGNFVRGFRGFIGVTDPFTAELHGIHKGLEILDKLGYHGAILESDCEPVVNWINGKDHNNTSKSKIIRDSWSIIVDCRRLAHNNNTAINHVKGDDANQCAHKLADLAIDKEDKYVEIEDVSQLPFEIKSLVDKDAKTIGYPSN